MVTEATRATRAPSGSRVILGALVQAPPGAFGTTAASDLPLPADLVCGADERGEPGAGVQKDMMEDHKRTGAYHAAILNNRRCFEGKVVLDVGTGSGILAIFAAQAGAKKVYAVEATDMAKLAKKMVDSNSVRGPVTVSHCCTARAQHSAAPHSWWSPHAHTNAHVACVQWSDVVEVIQGTVETVSLPEKVDIIVSEWMGYFLMRESMLDSVIAARDKFLKEGGSLFPSHCRMMMVRPLARPLCVLSAAVPPCALTCGAVQAPIRTNATEKNHNEHLRSLDEWNNFVGEVRAFYDVDLRCLTKAFESEQRDYLLQTATWSDVHPGNLLGQSAVLKEFDLQTISMDEVQGSIRSSFELLVTRPGPIQGLAGFFDATFRGSLQQPAEQEARPRSPPPQRTPARSRACHPARARCTRAAASGERVAFTLLRCRTQACIAPEARPCSSRQARDMQVVLSTAPDASGATHWGQLTFQLHPPISAAPGDRLRCDMDMVRQEKNNRLLHVKLKIKLEGDSEYAQNATVRECAYKID